MRLLPYFLRGTYWLRDFFKGSPVRSHYNDIRLIMENHGIGEKRRNQYLDNLLRYVTVNSAFYSSYKCESLLEFPIVNKSVLIQNYDSIKIDADDIPNHRGLLTIKTTSGSTGTPFSLPLDYQKSMRRVAELKYFGERVKYKSHEKLVHLRIWNKWQSKTGWQRIRENIVPFDISHLKDEKLKELCDVIRKTNAVALRGYASSIDLLLHYVAKNNIEFPSLKIIIAGSESLKDTTRELVTGHLKCEIVSQYANQENGILAQQAVSGGPESPYYLNYASYFFEILKLDNDLPADYGELGRIVITDLFNYAFPMIRYDTGDTGVMGMGDDDMPVICKLYGRRIDLVYDTESKVVYPMAVAMLLKHYPEIIQWQFIQKGRNQYCLNLSVRKGEFKETEIRIEFEKLFGRDAEFDFEFVDDIPILSSGKRKMVLNNWRI